MNAKTPIPDHLVKAQAFVLTPDKIKELEPSDLMRINVEGAIHNAKSNHQYAIGIAWPDGTFCTFGSNSPLTIEQLFPVMLQTAYRNSFFDQRFDTWLE